MFGLIVAWLISAVSPAVDKQSVPRFKPADFRQSLGKRLQAENRKPYLTTQEGPVVQQSNFSSEVSIKTFFNY